MGEAIGDVLPLALGVAISPVPIMAVVLMLFSPRAASTGWGFLTGWVLGVVAAVVTLTVLAGLAGGERSDGPATAVSWVKVVLAVLFLLLAVKQWRSRPAPGTEPEPAGWMKAFDTLTGVRAVGLGFLLSGLSPKNLAMAIGAGVAIGGAGIPGGQQAASVAVFVLIASSTVAVPVVGYAVAADRMRGPLDELKSWLELNRAAVMTVLLTVIGIVVLGQGLRGLL